MQPSVLLTTKFLVPRRNPDRLDRPHLLDRLESCLDKRLTLLSAPPGYGKTTLLADLTAATRWPYAWYQIDEADSDPTIFLSYLLACFRHIQSRLSSGGQPGANGWAANGKRRPATGTSPIGAATQALLDNADAATALSPRHILTVLINELADAIVGEWLLILEDYHLIANPVVQDLMNRLLENAPPGLHVIISTRADPPLSLARLRARGELAELRAGDLRFTFEEISAWLSQSVPGVSAQNALLLGEKTEGWAAALQIVLSSLSGKDPDSANRFIADLSGTHRYIFEYLAEEVFQQQQPARQQFLTRTAILDQMNARACNGLLGITDSQSTLECLEQENLFVVSLDEQREWYRYHHLFREFLLGKLRRQQPAEIPALERTAACYYEEQGELEAAFNHYLRGRQLDAAARVLIEFAPDYLERGRVAVLQRYLNELPEPIIGRFPTLLLIHGDVCWRLGQVGTAVTRYVQAREAYAEAGDGDGVGRVLTQLAELARSQGDYGRGRELAAQALAQVPADSHAARAQALMALAKIEGFLTGMERGRSLAEEALAAARIAGEAMSPRLRANLLRSLGHICWWHGDPQATVRYCQEALHSIPDELSPTAATVYITMATPYIYWRDFATAQQYAERGLEMAQYLQLPELLPRAYTTLGSVLARRGDTARAESCLRQAVELSQGLGLESYARVMATGYLAQVMCSQGRTQEARQLAEAALWAHASNPHTYEVYVCRSVLADIALESDELEQAQSLFQSLVEVGERRQFRIPLAMVYFGLAYTHLVAGSREQGLAFALQSLEHIEPTGTLQLYLDQGERARVVCQALWDNGVRTPFITQVLENLTAGGSAPAVTLLDQSAVRIRCLGPFQVIAGGETVTQERWVSAKARDLLAYFVTFRHERVPVERAFDAIWSGSAGRGLTAFHTALYRLRRALQVENQSAKFILVEAGEYWLDAARFVVDVDEFDAALAKAGSRTDEEAAYWLEQAVALYQGDYLSNLLYYDWAQAERRRLAEAYLVALSSLASQRAAAGQPRKALGLVEQILERDPLREDSHRQAMRLYAELGDRPGLVRQYQRLEAVLMDELEVRPLAASRQLYETLLVHLDTGGRA